MIRGTTVGYPVACQESEAPLLAASIFAVEALHLLQCFGALASVASEF